MKDVKLVEKKRGYLKDTKLMSLLFVRTKVLAGLYKVINEFKKGYKPITNLIQDMNGNLLAYYHNSLNRCKNCSC
jgi:hypothetical protein